MSVAGPRPNCISWNKAAASARVAPSNAGEERNARASPAARAKVPAPTGLPPPSIGTTRDLAVHRGGGTSAACGAAIIAATTLLAAGSDLGTGAAFKSLTNALPFQYQRWSAAWPLIITAERSLPPTATLRLAGFWRFNRSPRVGTLR